MPDTRPGIVFNKDGICQPCLNYEKKKTINWDARWKELKILCDKHRGENKPYDCAIAVSGGKDSHVQVHILKDLMHMNPVLLTVDNFSWTETGRRNLENISEAFGCDIITFTPNRKVEKILSKRALITLGSPMWYADAAIYAFPYRMAMDLGIKLLFYGENVSYEYGGPNAEETPYAFDQPANGVVKLEGFKKLLGDGVERLDIESVTSPSLEEVKNSGMIPIYLSYYVFWDSYHNYQVAKRLGFRHLDHEWKREGTIENFNQIDSPGYLINQWFKYPKYGHASVTEMASRYIRADLMSRDEAIPLVKKFDKNLDQRVLDDFLRFINMDVREFWDIADTWYNPQLFEKDRWGVWREKFELK